MVDGTVLVGGSDK